MAMAAEPDILVFDEPTTALDVTTQVEVLASFRNLIRVHGTAALYITHDLAVVAQIADRIMVLRHGKMVEFGDAAQILQQPKEEYTQRLVAERVAGHSFVAQGAAGAPVLDVVKVTASYRTLPRVIDDVSLQVLKGDTLAVVGEFGSGKSTLARVIVGLLPREAGDIRFRGESLPARLKDRSRDQLRRVQMIYQMPDVAVNPHQTLLDVIGRPVRFYFNRSRDEVRARVIELLRQIDLPEDFIKRKPGELSGGQKQRVCIARALAAEPDLIICDEVTSALDQLVGEEILRLLKRLQDQLGIAYRRGREGCGCCHALLHQKQFGGRKRGSRRSPIPRPGPVQPIAAIYAAARSCDATAHSHLARLNAGTGCRRAANQPDDEEVAVFPMEFGHEIEVHAIDTGNGGRDRQHRRPSCQPAGNRALALLLQQGASSATALAAHGRPLSVTSHGRTTAMQGT